MIDIAAIVEDSNASEANENQSSYANFESKEMVEGIVESIKDESISDVLKNQKYISFDDFIMNPLSGLTKKMLTGKGENMKTIYIPVSGPFEILGKCRGPNGREWGKLIRFQDADKRIHMHYVSDAALQGDPRPLCGSLADKGLHINRLSQNFLVEYLGAVFVTSLVMRVDHTGWHNIKGHDVFILPDQTIAPCGLSEMVVLKDASHAAYETSGALKDWQDNIGLLSKDHSLMKFAISASLAGPLIEFIGGDSGGYNFYGPSSIGKSSLLRSAASVWGKGTEKGGFVRSWRSTANALEGAAAIATDTLLVLDELGVGGGQDVYMAIYQLSNGSGKGRLNRDDSLRQLKSWRVMVLSSGELTIEAKITEDKKQKVRAGQTVRILDIAADRGHGFGVFDSCGVFSDAGKLADTIKEAAAKSYGTAGPAFVEKIIKSPRTLIEKIIKSGVAKISAKMITKDATEQIGRAAKRFALVAVSGEIAIKFGIVPWKKGEAEKAAIELFEGWLAQRGGLAPFEEQQALAQVRLLLEQYGDSRFDDPKDGNCNMSPTPIHNRLGWRNGMGANREWMVPVETWKTEFCKGHDPVYVAKTLDRMGMLRRQNKKHLTCQQRIDGRQVRVYVLKAVILDG